MELLKQCQKWHENDEHQKIVDALEVIPKEERTAEIDMELARAYNNLADPETPEGRRELRRAVKLMEPHPGDDPKYNTRQEIEQLIESCRKCLIFPRFLENFRQRTQKAWKAFAEQEADLRRFMDEDKDHERGEELIEQCNEILGLAFDDISFEMGKNKEKYELILTPQGDRVKFFELIYFYRHAPKEVLEHWNILVGRQPNESNSLRAYGCDVSGDDVQVWVEKRNKDNVGLTLYSEKLLPLAQKDENGVWWMLSTLTDLVLGELPAMRYVDKFHVAKEPQEGPAILLSALPETLKNMGFDLTTDPEAYVDMYTSYQMEPDKDPEADWRLDVIAGSTNCVPLINGYMSGEDEDMDMLHADGAVGGFLCYPLDSFTGEDRSQQIFDLRDELEEKLTESFGPDVLTLTGGATGLYCGYVDFIAWDLNAAVHMAQEFFADKDLPWASFHVFRRNVGTVPLKDQDEENREDQEVEDESSLNDWEYVPYTRENADAFYQQIEQWNDENEYSRCVKVLDTVPEQLRDYRCAYALARALENYAILGDHEEGTANYKSDKALQRAIEVLESVREEGQDNAQWNMRMAYAYQYLHGQEEKAIPYAQRWAQLDPSDEDAPTVIRECQEELAKRSNMDVIDEDDAENSEGQHDSKGTFAGFVLLSKGKWDKEQLIRDLKEKWNIAAQEHDESEDKSDDALVFEVGDLIAAVSLMPAPIPNGEAEINAENNYMWPDAVEVAKNHSAHLMVAVLGKEEDLLERGKLYTKLVAACCRQKYATGVYTSGVVFEPRFYEGFADMMKEDELPIFNWIWFGLYRSEGGMCAYTYGMDVFGKDEMEVVNADAEPSDLRDFLASLVSYVLESDVELHNGETIGFSANDKHAITRSEGVALPGMTLKISYEPSQDGTDDDRDNSEGDEDDDVLEMDDAAYHLETLREKKLSVDERAVYNHMAIYLRWCMEHELMGKEFLEEYGDLVQQVKADHAGVDLRAFIQNELDGQLFTTLFNKMGKAFAHYYYGENDSPYFPSDIDNYAMVVIGQERNYSDEIQDEAYLFIPFDENYYQAMAKVLDKRFANWQGQDFDKDTLEPSELAQAMMDYLGCECTYFPSMKDDDPIMSAYTYAKRDSIQEGFIPVLLKVDETLWECLVMNSDPDSVGADGYVFDAQKVAKYRKKVLASPLKDGKTVLDQLIDERKEEAEDDDINWKEEILGEMEGGYDNCRFASYWNSDTDMTFPLILAKIPVKNPWEIFAYLPFGNWNDCPDIPELMAVAKYWFQQYGAVPGAMTHDELEFVLPVPILKQKAMKAAVELYGFCPDIVDQGPEDATVGSLADVLWQSTVWYFWWD